MPATARKVRSKTDPWGHQVKGVDLIRQQNCILNWDMGTGKSKAIVDYICNTTGGTSPVSYTHLTLPTNREV